MSKYCTYFWGATTPPPLRYATLFEVGVVKNILTRVLLVHRTNFEVLAGLSNPVLSSNDQEICAPGLYEVQSLQACKQQERQGGGVVKVSVLACPRADQSRRLHRIALFVCLCHCLQQRADRLQYVQAGEELD